MSLQNFDVDIFFQVKGQGNVEKGQKRNPGWEL
jgi:hypothetical protein